MKIFLLICQLFVIVVVLGSFFVGLVGKSKWFDQKLKSLREKSWFWIFDVVVTVMFWLGVASGLANIIWK